MQLLDEVRSSCRAIARDAPRFVTIDLDAAARAAARVRRPAGAAARAARRPASSSSTRSTSARAGSRRCASGPGMSGYRTHRGRLRRARAVDQRASCARSTRPPSRRVLGQEPRPSADAPLRAGAARPRPLPRRALARSTWSSEAAARPSGWPTLLAARHALLRRPRLLQARADRARATWRWPAWPTSTTSTGSRSSPTTSSRTSCAWTACCATTPELAARIDAGELLPQGARRARDPRLRACTPASSSPSGPGSPPRVLDVRLWNRGQAPEYKAVPRHRTRSVYY